MPHLSRQIPANDDASLSADLLNLYDEFVDFHNNCSFLLDATSTLFLSNTDIDRVSAEGLSSLSWQMKRKAGELKEAFKQLHEKSRRVEAACKNVH